MKTKKRRDVIKEETELMKTAVHEAGHAYASWRFKIPIHHVSCVPDDESLGRVVSASVADLESMAKNYSRSGHRRIEEWIIVLFAGRAAEKRYANGGTWRQARGDLDAVKFLIPELFPENITQLHAGRFYNSCAQDLVAGPLAGACIPYLARELVRCKSMSGAKVKAAFCRAIASARSRQGTDSAPRSPEGE